MNAAAAFSTGISVRWPRNDHHRVPASAAPFDEAYAPSHADREADVLQPHDSSSNTHFSGSDRENYSGCQELAYQYAIEQTKSTVRAVLLKANANCYHQVLRYFERYMSVTASTPSQPRAEPQHSTTASSDAPVAFPEYHGYPTAAILTGADATVSDVWVHPLSQVLQRSFPLVFVVPDDVPNARRLIEWIAEHLDGVQRVRESEEMWLLTQIDSFDMLDASAARDGASAAAKRVATLRSRSRRHTTPYSSGSKALNGGSDGDSDDDFVAFESGDDADSDSQDEADADTDSDTTRSWRPVASKKKRRRTGGRSRSRTGTKVSASAAVTDRPFAKWTIEQLLVRIERTLAQLLNPHEPCRQWLATLRDLVEARLDAALRECTNDVAASIQRFYDAIEWLKLRIAACRALAGRHATSSPTATVGATEFDLAQLLQSVLTRFVAFLDQELSAAPVTGDKAVAGRWRPRIAGVLTRHEDYYQLHHSRGSTLLSTDRQPFALLCIAQLEAFRQSVLDDFLVTWTNFVRSRHTESTMRWGIVVGVASSASPALRHIDVSLAAALELQFFRLDDSRSCWSDILESLVVDANLPLVLSGDVLRSVAGRHSATQSIARFLHALTVVSFDHFRSVPWSFIGHFALDAHAHRPLASGVHAPSRRLALWLQRSAAVRSANTLQDHLLLFSDATLESLRQRVFPVVSPTGDWLEALLDEVTWLRTQRLRWRIGWKCFRAACAWLEVALSSDDFAARLADALDGKLANSPTMHQAVQRLATCSLRVAAGLVDDWRSIVQDAIGIKTDTNADTSSLIALVQQLDELALVCQYAAATLSQPATTRMLPRVRAELQSTFCDRLIIALVQPPRTRLPHPLVLQWLTVTATTPLDQRLHVNYYDMLKDMLLAIEDGENDDSGHANGTSWVNDVSLAFLYYQESAGIYLSLRDWYDTFADALTDEFAARRRRSSSKTKRCVDTSSDSKADEAVETKARFLRAFCTLRHWGFVKSIGSSQGSDGDTIEKVVFI